MSRKMVTYKFAYYDDEGQRRGKTFTAYTMTEAKKKAHQWDIDHPRKEHASMSLVEAVRRYIAVKRASLSPSTVASYEDMLNTHIIGTALEKKDVFTLADVDVQKWVSDLALEDLSTKTIKNCYSLVSASCRMFAKKTFTVTFPQTRKTELYCPSNEDIKVLLDWLREHKRYDLERAVLLSAFGTLRAGEITALTSDDVDFEKNTITVNKSLVRNSSGEWEIKAPKTESSYRTIVMPEFVMNKLKGIDGKIVSYTPHSLGWMFREAVRRSGLKHFRFHDLRHYSASIMNYQGISDKTIQQRGGWATTHVMKRVYQNQIEDETRKETEQINGFFTSTFG